MWFRKLVVLGLAIAGCSNGSQTMTEVEVAAAASLAEAFEEMAAAFEAQYPDIAVSLNVAGSSQLREQILAESGQDVFASASATIMSEVEAAGALDGSSTVFASNGLALVVPVANPAGVDELSDLAEPSLLVGLCAEAVPCGELARRLLASRDVTPSVDTDEPNARALRTKLEAGELDVALLYVSDAFGNPDLAIVPVDPPPNVSTDYSVGVIAGSAHPEQARLFVEFLLSAQGQQILSEYGFSIP